MTGKATRLVIVTERLLLKDITKIIDAAGATGYTVTAAGGKGSRNVRSSGQPVVSDSFANVKIEVISADPDLVRRIADTVANRYFDNFSGITWLDEVEVHRLHKFRASNGVAPRGMDAGDEKAGSVACPFSSAGPGLVFQVAGVVQRAVAGGRGRPLVDPGLAQGASVGLEV